MAYEVTATDEEWRNNLGPDRFAVLRQAATEPPFTGKYTHDKTNGRLPLRRLRGTAVFQQRQVRFRFGLAELLRADDDANRSSSSRTVATGWCAPRCVAPAAAATSATSSTTVRRRPASVSA